jgi:hypothetical protein
MRQKLSFPLTSLELKATLGEMAQERSLGSNGPLVEFYQLMWDMLGEHTYMLDLSIQVGQLSTRMTSNMIVLLHKRGESNCLSDLAPNLSIKSLK